MRLPSKVTPYEKSVIASFPVILAYLERQDISPKDLFEIIVSDENDMGDFLSALDCLFALGKIDLLEEGVLHYVG